MGDFLTAEWLASAQQVKEWIKAAAASELKVGNGMAEGNESQTNGHIGSNGNDNGSKEKYKMNGRVRSNNGHVGIEPKVLVGIKKLGGSPTAVYCNARGHIWSVVHNHTLVKVTATGEVMLKVGQGGQPGFADGALSSARFNFGFWLSGLSEDHSGSLHFTDPANHAIRCLSPDESQVMTKVGFSGQAGRSDGPLVNASFHYPTSLAISSSGAFFVADTGNCCVRLIHNGQVSTITGGTPIASHEISRLLTSPCPTPLGVAAGLVYTPKGQLLVADAGNHSIRRIAQDRISTIAGSFAGLRNGPTETALFVNPTALTLTPAGDLLVCDLGNNMIRAIGDGTVSTLFSYSASPLANDYQSSLSSFVPCGITLGLNGCIYIAESQGIMCLSEQKGFIKSTTSPSPSNLIINPESSNHQRQHSQPLQTSQTPQTSQLPQSSQTQSSQTSQQQSQQLQSQQLQSQQLQPTSSLQNTSSSFSPQTARSGSAQFGFTVTHSNLVGQTNSSHLIGHSRSLGSQSESPLAAASALVNSAQTSPMTPARAWQTSAALPTSLLSNNLNNNNNNNNSNINLVNNNNNNNSQNNIHTNNNNNNNGNPPTASQSQPNYAVNPIPIAQISWRLQGKFDFGQKEIVPCIEAIPVPSTENMVQVRAALLVLIKRVTLLYVKAASFISSDLFDCDPELVALVTKTSLIVGELCSTALSTPVAIANFKLLLESLKENAIAYDRLLTTSISALLDSSDSD